MVVLSELVIPEGIFLDVEGDTPAEALTAISRKLVEANLLGQSDAPRLLEVIQQREEVCSTAVGMGAAIPHAYFDKLTRPLVIICRLARSIDYCSPDEQPVDLIFVLLGPLRDDAKHIQILSKIVRMIKDQKFDQDLRGATTAAEVMNAVHAVEKRHN